MSRVYKVGYKKPPHETRFKKGQSGNPKGRPPGKKNLQTVLNDALRERVTVAKNGQYKKISKLEAIVTQLVDRANSGDAKAMPLLLTLLRDFEGRADPGAPDSAAFTEADERIIERIRARFGGKRE